MASKPKSPVHVTSFKELVLGSGSRQQVEFVLNGKTVSVLIRPLSSAELAEANEILAKILPPKIPVQAANPVTRVQETRMELDYDDAQFRDKVAKGQKLRRAFILEKGLVEMKPEGKSLEEMADWLEKNLQNSVLTLLVREIEAISDGDLEVISKADFFSKDASTVAPN